MEPKWNVKIDKDGTRRYSHRINGTKVECKEVIGDDAYINKLVLMEPKWNVKMEYGINYLHGGMVLMEPKWNVKSNPLQAL